MEENINNQTNPPAGGPQTPPSPTAPAIPPVTKPQPPVPKSNKTLLFVILGIVLVVILGTIYVIAMGKNSTANKTAAPSPIVEQPTATPSPTPSDDINSVEVPNPDTELSPINQDLNQL